MREQQPAEPVQEYITTATPRAWASGVPVFCAHDKVMPIGELRPNPKNPNHHPPEQIKLLAYVIRTQGWRAPITVSTRSGLIVRGHGRLEAALLDDLEEVPVDFQEYGSEAEEMADLVADNRIAELSDIDNRKLADAFAEIDTGEIPFLLSGYTEEQYQQIVTALSEAIHDEEPQEEPAEEDAGAPVTQVGDVWLLGAKATQASEETMKGILSRTSKRAAVVIVEIEPAQADATVARYIREAGKKLIRCIRGGQELARSKFEGIFERAAQEAADAEGGGRE